MDPTFSQFPICARGWQEVKSNMKEDITDEDPSMQKENRRGAIQIVVIPRMCVVVTWEISEFESRQQVTTNLLKGKPT